VTSLFAGVDHLVIAVRDLDAAAAAYTEVLGVAPSWRGSHPSYGTANVLFALANCYLELLALGAPTATHPVAHTLAARLEQQPESLFALALRSDDLDGTTAGLHAAGIATTDVADGEGVDAAGGRRRWRSCVLSPADTRGVHVLAIEHADGSVLPPGAGGAAEAVVSAVDHVVLFSDDAARSLALWRDRLGLRETWRREFPDRGTVNVGLRLGGVTLELIGPLTEPSGSDGGGDRLWGVAYRVGDCDAAVTRLRAAGIAASDARPGLAPRTRVATVKWRDRLPTLLLEKRQV
jgi:catechol 2,3-dioxygenase-like lactoylglutathione lyase family enzyme